MEEQDGKTGASSSEAMRVSLERLMERVEQSAAPYLRAAMHSTDHSYSVQLCYMLVMICKSTALIRVANAGSQEGLVGWRLLVLQHEPTPFTRSAVLNSSFDRESGGRLAPTDARKRIKNDFPTTFASEWH